MLLTRAQKQEINQVFELTDTVGAGLLDGEGLYKALRALGLEVPVSEGGINDLLRSVDRQDEGYIDVDDFKKIVSDLMTRKNDEQREDNHDYDQEEEDGDEDEEEFIDDHRRDDAFRVLAAKDGMITLDSLRQASQAQGESWTTRELEEMLNEADRNHDGVVDPAEFERIWKLAGLG
ncbi:hypothetical protein BDB00DRAFT_819410 [Zychaea mexicana]|uniref:uncharacterized protein n=1 Tax=Zychaea mexicana TaxID=64656 RepID=UPI0022FE187A|nr:uncharacterized protein BDB00DRAFT_819410 [Zychaea mexicana]KAI9494246.1 hypothetical protein BDB00DRAFT_819410 [Zychaea mexicana]